MLLINEKMLPGSLTNKSYVCKNLKFNEITSYFRQFNFTEFKAVGKHMTLSQRHEILVYKC